MNMNAIRLVEVLYVFGVNKGVGAYFHRAVLYTKFPHPHPNVLHFLGAMAILKSSTIASRWL